LEQLLVFSLLFLSNILAFWYAFWLVPQLLLLIVIFFLIATVLSVWILYKRNLALDFLQNLKTNWVIFPFLIFSGLTIFWSVNREVSVLRWLTLICTVLTGGYIGLRYSAKEIVRFLSVFSVYILILSSIFVFFIPDIGIMNYYTIQGAWKGVYWHKNHMGLIATFINLLFLINVIDLLPLRAKRVWLWFFLYIYSLLFMFQTDSVAAYLTTILLHGVVFLGWILLKFKDKIRRSYILIITGALLLASVALYLNAEQFLGMFNRNTSLTGRVPMWSYLFDTYVSKRLLVGYGFNAFWYIKTYQEDVQRAAGYPDPIIISDNGFIDILVNTGYLGLSLFMAFYIWAAWRSIQYSIHAKDIINLFPALLILFITIANITWSLLFENEGFFMLLMIAILFSISNRIQTNRGSV
jgi:O-antigen ligase